MIAAPEISVTLANLRYDSHVFAAQVSQALLPASNSARLLFPARVNIEAAPGDDASMTLTSGEYSETVITGSVKSVERRPHHTIVVLCDGSAALAKLRPANTFARQTSDGIVNSLAQLANIQVATNNIQLNLPQFAAHQKRTAAEHIAKLAEFSDGFAFVDGLGQLKVNTWSEGPADAAIKYGRDIFDYRFTQQQNPTAVSAIGNGAAGSSEDPEALRQATGSLPESAPAPGLDNIWLAEAILRTPAAQQLAQTGINRGRNQRAQQGSLLCHLRPDFFPGIKLEIQDINNVSGNWIVQTIVHEIAEGAFAHSRLQVRADASGESLLGSLLDAVGGLF